MARKGQSNAGAAGGGGVPEPLASGRAALRLSLRQGDLSGSVVGRARIARSNSMNQWPKNLGDPNVEASWVEAGMFSGGKAVLSGFTPGTTVRLRLRTADIKGIKGVMGA